MKELLAHSHVSIHCLYMSNNLIRVLQTGQWKVQMQPDFTDSTFEIRIRDPNDETLCNSDEITKRLQ